VVVGGGISGLAAAHFYRARLGVDMPALARKVEHRRFYASIGLRQAAFFDRETFGADHLAVVAKLLAHAPLSLQARLDMARILEGAIDYLPGLAGEQKKDRLSRISYRDFLRDVAKVDPAVLAYDPDGNATIARLLVRSLIPASMPGTSAADVVTAHAGRQAGQRRLCTRR
jgi:spermidine dehydrogenase